MFRKLSMALATGVLATAAVSVPAAAGTTGDATVWVAHGIPGAKVDVCVGGGAVREDFRFGQRFKAVLPAGSYTIRVRLDHHEACKGAVVIKQTVAVTSGLNATAIAVVKGTKPQLAIYLNETEAPRTAGGVGPSVSVIHEATAPAVDVWVARTIRLRGAAGPTLSDVERGEKRGPVGVPADVYALWASVSGSTKPVIGPSVRTLGEDRAYTVIAVGTKASNYRFITFGQPFGS